MKGLFCRGLSEGQGVFTVVSHPYFRAGSSIGRAFVTKSITGRPAVGFLQWQHTMPRADARMLIEHFGESSLPLIRATYPPGECKRGFLRVLVLWQGDAH